MFFLTGTHGRGFHLRGVGRGGLLGVLLFHRLGGEGTLGVGDGIVRHALVREEVRALERALRGDDPGKDIGVEFMLQTVPIEFL